ncbi:MAG TPA: hypothetical protein VHZ07_20325 [Bryobacteraceae bacterium]|jgi:hypothetical protein|nr:hypothetical protein [Bryobacteraceae bacterium]
MEIKSDALTNTVRDLLQKYSARELPLTKTEKGNRADAASIQSTSPNLLFPGARAPEAAVSGLLLLAGCWEESHQVSQDIKSTEGSYWHAIAHRVEPDSSNAGHWFRRVGEHGIFAELRRRSSEILESTGTPWALKPAWDPFLFIEWCEQARRAPGTKKERAALEIQRAEWDLLFEWCAFAAHD